MKTYTLSILIVLTALLLLGCAQSGPPTGYAGYGGYGYQGAPPPGQQNNHYIGGGCGVAPQASYDSTPVQAVDSVAHGA